eukprot:CAMPEP_0176137940 /NCGR_PEP_ID=MMETSP0120_2-20121206/70050_1 /TAXON_ID=160619 /ORGANISM="Kryptoperidinium foliaceum, Strain CCMP 1326" /LENGTH=121 /DNA_ID=CAMNT_0017473833 /DNA_START=78 /DNA_END=439 /DNA_ORIENTATION=+
MNPDGDAFAAAAAAAGIPPPRIGPCALGAACTAPDQELSEQYRCRHCRKQLHGFISGCSQAMNTNDFRDGVICKQQPCVPGAPGGPAAVRSPTAANNSPQGRADGAVKYRIFLNLLEFGRS